MTTARASTVGGHADTPRLRQAARWQDEDDL